MKYTEANALYKEEKYEEALEGFKELIGCYGNINVAAFWKALECCVILCNYMDGNELILKFIDKVDFPHQRVHKKICTLYKNYFNVANEEEQEHILNTLYNLWLVSKKENYNYLPTYGNLIRKYGKPEIFIKEIDDDNDLLTNLLTKSAYLWCIYDKYIKSFNLSNSTEVEIQDFYDKAKYIVDNCNQLKLKQYNFNPYVITVNKVVSVIRGSNNVDYLKIQEWLLKLNVKELPYDNEIQFTLENGRQCEKASSREFYYYQLAKAFESTNKYKECIDICEEAQREKIKWHYRNGTWIQYRKLYCKCIISNDKDKDITAFKRFVDNNKFWYMYAKLADVYFRNGKIHEALYYGCKAFTIKEEEKKLINLILDLSYYFEANNRTQDAKLFLNAYLYIRKKQSWSIPYEEECRAMNYGIENNATIDMKILYEICTSYIADANYDSKKYYKGKIIKFISNNKSGFIKEYNGDSIFFNMIDIENSIKPKIGDIVKYSIGSNKKGKKAIDIYIVE